MSYETFKPGRFVLAILLVAGLAACSDDNSPTDPDPGPEVPLDPIVETFRADLPQLMEICHFFETIEVGDIRMTITELEPLPSLTVGLRLGVPLDTDPNVCSTLGEDRATNINDTFLSSALLPGTYCVCVFDVGNIFPDETISYVLEVTHF